MFHYLKRYKRYKIYSWLSDEVPGLNLKRPIQLILFQAVKDLMFSCESEHLMWFLKQVLNNLSTERPAEQELETLQMRSVRILCFINIQGREVKGLSGRCATNHPYLHLGATRVKITQLLASLQTTRNKLCSHDLLQVVNKFGTSC